MLTEQQSWNIALKVMDDYIFTIVNFQVPDEKKRQKAAQLFFNLKDRLEYEIYSGEEELPIFNEYKSFFNKYQRNKE